MNTSNAFYNFRRQTFAFWIEDYLLTEPGLPKFGQPIPAGTATKINANEYDFGNCKNKRFVIHDTIFRKCLCKIVIKYHGAKKLKK